SLLRVGGTHDVAITRDGVVTFQHLHDDRTRAHVTHQVPEEGTLAMHGIEALGLLLRELQHAGGDDGEATLLESAADLADQVGLHAVGLDDGQGGLEGHSLWPFEMQTSGRCSGGGCAALRASVAVYLGRRSCGNLAAAGSTRPARSFPGADTGGVHAR